MKVHITNIYGGVENSQGTENQKAFAEAGHLLGFYEMGIFVYPVETDTQREVSTRLDGIIAAVEHNDLVIVQLPTGNGIDFEALLMDKIVAYSNRKVFVLWHDDTYYDQNHERFSGYIERDRKVNTQNVSDEIKQAQFLLEWMLETERTILPDYHKQELILELWKENECIPIKVKNIDETLDYVLLHQSSVSRFGDGEMDLMAGNSIPYQDYRESLAEQLKIIVAKQSDEKLVVCLSDVFEKRDRYNQFAAEFWEQHLNQYKDLYRKLCRADWYGSTFISRPYMDLVDKTPCGTYFRKIRKLWENRNILIVEGKNSRSGVGNDLFDQAASVQRIICPSRNAYDDIEKIQEEILKHISGKLVLLMLGPTAKVLAYNISNLGYQAIDLGHIDSEYEWFKMGATSKVKLHHKHTAEHNFDQDIEFLEDEKYDREVIVNLCKEVQG